MALVDSVKKALGLKTTPGVEAEGREAGAREDGTGTGFVVPEVTSGELLTEQSNNPSLPLLLDIREPFERARAFIPGSLHIPMNSLPSHLGELDPAQDIVVYCAHGNRSYGVTGWLIQQGFKARSLKGGIADWQQAHGAIERG